MRELPLPLSPIKCFEKYNEIENSTESGFVKECILGIFRLYLIAKQFWYNIGYILAKYREIH